MTDQQKALLAGAYALLELALPTSPTINPAMHLLSMLGLEEQKIREEAQLPEQDDNCG